MNVSENKEWCDIYPTCAYYKQICVQEDIWGHDETESHCTANGGDRIIIPSIHCRKCILGDCKGG